MNISKNTVTLWVLRYTKFGKIIEQKKSGRSRKTTLEQDQQILKLVKNKEQITDDRYTIDDIKNDLEKINIFICNSTIINRMKEKDYYCGYPFRKPFLTRKQKDNRLIWAKNNLMTDWTKVIFSDETKVVKGGTFDKKIWIGPETNNIKRVQKHSIRALRTIARRALAKMCMRV